MFEEYINKKVRLNIDVEGRTFRYTAVILDVNKTHIRFKDREGTTKIFRLDQVIELTEIGGDKNE